MPTEIFKSMLNITKPNMLIARQTYNSTELFWGQAGNITEITFEDTINVPEGVTSWDMSVNQDGSIMSYIIDDGLRTNTYKLYIQGDGIIYANPNSSHLFREFTKLTKISNLNLLDISKVTTMTSMFSSCTSLISLDISSFYIIKVLCMHSMFSHCISLTNLNLSNATFTSVTSYSEMFYYITNGINITVKDSDAQTFINSRLTDAGKTGNVTIYVP